MRNLYFVALFLLVSFIAAPLFVSAQSINPVITSIVPEQASANTNVTIYGSNLSGTGIINFFLPNSDQPKATWAPTSVSAGQVAFKLSDSFVANVTPGSYQIGVVTNACPGCWSNKLNIGINVPTTSLSILENSLPHAKVGQSYSATINTSGVDSSNGYNWSVDNNFPLIGFSFGPSYGNSIRITGIPSKVYMNGVEKTDPYTFTFNVTVHSGSQTATKQFSLTVDPSSETTQSNDLAVSFSVSPSTITAGQKAELKWSSINATSCVTRTPDQNSEIKGMTFGAREVSPYQSSVYQITCFNSSGQSVSSDGTLLVNPAPTCPTSSFNITNKPLDLKVNCSDGPITIAKNSTVNLSWSSSPTVGQCVKTRGPWTSSNTAGKGSQISLPITDSEVFSISCQAISAGKFVTVEDSVVVTVGDNNLNAISNLDKPTVQAPQPVMTDTQKQEKIKQLQTLLISLIQQLIELIQKQASASNN